MQVFEDGKKSLTGFVWEVATPDDYKVRTLEQKTGVSNLLARLMVERDITPETLETFLHPTLKNDLPNPNTLKDMEKAAQRVALAIMFNEPIGIMGDYDVDGATSTATLKMFLESLGVRVFAFIPDREDGYGPNAKKMVEYKEKGCTVVLTLDCGTTAYEAIEAGTKTGLDVIILDHHNAESKLPNAYAIVNAKRLDEPVDHPCHHLAAVGVTFLFVVALNAELRKQGFYQTRPEPDLKQYLDLVAFGTVCDVVRLRGVNRLLVQAGLREMRQGRNKGLLALCQRVQINTPVQTYHLGYILGPRINACGRIGQSDLGMQLLSCSDPVKTAVLAEELESLNAIRRQIEADVMLQAMEQVESETQKHPFLVVKGENWHQGVVGIVAGRLKDRYNLPVFALSIEGDEVKGSSRSVAGIDIGTIIMNALTKGLITRGGGHPMAAGFSLRVDQLDGFVQYLEEIITPEALKDNPTSLQADALVDIGGITLDLVSQLEPLEPYGEGNPEPKFIIPNARLVYVNLLKNGHVICNFTGANGQRVNAIAFKVADTEMGTALLAGMNQKFHLLGTLKKDTWNGKTKIQIQLQDVMQA
ncbi:MAG: single-stranded-DNA-specific exonuclease RecJ [Alphaproteobacteria bacterium]|nr:single-stranded-DNA-specific exonuclease RecJ [Alphaproteobacteria bacterium]